MVVNQMNLKASQRSNNLRRKRSKSRRRSKSTRRTLRKTNIRRKITRKSTKKYVHSCKSLKSGRPSKSGWHAMGLACGKLVKNEKGGGT